MTTRDFCYWLQGFFELSETIDHRKGATPETMDMIKAHLNLVFRHDIDPSIDKGNEEYKQELNNIHSGNKFPPYDKDGIVRC